MFGDIQRGRLFAADLAAMKKADDGVPQTVAPVEEIQLYMRGAGGNRVYVTLRDLVERAMGASVTRADLHISQSRDGELFVTSRQDGVIRMLVPDSGLRLRRVRHSSTPNLQLPIPKDHCVGSWELAIGS